MRNKKILLLWYQWGDNFGDVLLYQTSKQYLESAGYCVESHEVGDSEIKIAEHANLCGFVMFAGGGIIERYVPRVIRNIKELKRLLCVPYGVIGVGIGEFDYQQHSDALKYWVEQAEFFYVRDKATRNYLNKLTRNSKVIFSGDVVFAHRTISKDIKVGSGIGLNMRDIPYTDVQGEFDWNIINKAVDRAKCNILIPDCNAQIANLQGVFDNLKDVENYERLSRNAKVEKVILTMQKCNIIVAMRFHVVLVAALLGIIPIPVLYCPKVRYLAEQLGIMELAIELGEWEKIPEKVELVMRNKDKYLKELANNISVLQKNVQEMYNVVTDKLNEV